MRTTNRIFATTICLQVIIGACGRQDLTSTPLAPTRAITAVGPVSDDVMGDFSPIAQYVSAALQDSTIRFRLAAVLRSPSFSGSIIDLQDCSGNQGSLVADLLAAGERRGFGSAVSVCEKLRARIGVSLYMSPSRASGWDPSTVPIVTAIDGGSRQRVGTFKGYLSPSKTIDLPDDGKIGGAIIVILGSPHPDRLRTLKPSPLDIKVRNAPPAKVR